MNARAYALLALSFALLMPASATAAKTATLKVAAGKGGPYDKGEDKPKEYAGPGTEQPTTAWIRHEDTKTVDVVTVWMSSDVSAADRPWQGKCSVLQLGATGEPKVLVDQQQLTHLGDPNSADERPFNHPHLIRVAGAKNASSMFLLTYGSDAGNGNVQTYAVLIDAACTMVSSVVRISDNNNNNEGAPECAYNGKGWATCGYYDNNDQRTYAIPLMVDDSDAAKPKLVKLDTPKTIVTPANIGRPSIIAVSENRSLLCAAKGNNRPPEDGVQCAYLALDANGKLSILWKEYIDESNPGQGIYYNQPTVRNCGENTACFLTLRSNGNGKNSNDKGQTTTMFSVATLSDTSWQIKAKRDGIGLNQAHTGLCTGQFGANGGSLRAVVYDAPITGAGQPGAQIVSYDAVTKKISFDEQKEYYTVGFVADSGHLANLYGQNPNVQGRDFMRCVGDVPNPAWNQVGGWQNDVQSFFAFPHSGRLKKTDEEPKNALYLTLLPGQTKEPQLPAPPLDIQQVTVDVLLPSTTSVGAGGGNEPDPNPEPGDGLLFKEPQASSSCVMSAHGRHQDGALALALLLAVLGLARGRKEFSS